jgi:N-acetylglucosaminyldiphosphoundecaprenol N-acetyl-beta-D-mannosaminyltransferase
MPIVAAIVALAALVWGAVYARRGSLLLGCGMLLAVSYAFGHMFWNANIGSLPITLDRLLLLGLAAAFAIRWRIGRLSIRPLTASDWALAATLLLFAASALLSGQPDFSDGITSKWGRLIASLIIPAVMFCAIRHAPITPKEATWLVAGFVAFGLYLAVTAFCESAGLWSFVIPRYIANPNLGIHFGRARGPELNSVSLGTYLTACILCAWTLLRLVKHCGAQLAVAVTMPLMALAVYLTYTRSTWLGLAASCFVIAAIEIPKRWRLPSITMAGIVGVLLLSTSWSSIVGLRREGPPAESSHSVDQRKSFAYLSWKMFQDNPLLGVGFGRFYDRKLPYLSDRSQSFELDSIRPLHHHNTLLSVLTETGLVGFAACATLFAVWTTNAWRLAHDAGQTRLYRACGILTLAIIANYFCSALFHDLTLLPSQQLLLFTFAGLAVNLRQSRQPSEPGGPPPRTGVEDDPARFNCFTIQSRRENAILADSRRATHLSSHVNLFGIQITRIAMNETVEQLLAWCREPRGEACRYVVTPNVDHAVMFQQRADLRAAYADASLVLADGTPIVVASRLLKRPLPERVAGSDLVPEIFQAANKSLRVFLLGAAPGVAEVAAEKIESRSKHVEIVGSYSPPLGFENDRAENSRILSRIAAANPDLLIVGFGAPKQELWVHVHRHALQAKVALCAGATIDFLAGNRLRSPIWMRRAGLEWLHRLGNEPRRLASRYARDAWIFPQLVWREMTNGEWEMGNGE